MRNLDNAQLALQVEDETPLPTCVRMEGDAVRTFAKGIELESFNWNELKSVRTWKEDYLTQDCIWLGFDLDDSDKTVCVNEEMEGYQSLIQEMQRRCASFDEKWWGKVIYPAFKENHAFIW